MSRSTSSCSSGLRMISSNASMNSLLVVDQAPERRQRGGAGQLAQVPGVLGEDVVRALLPAASPNLAPWGGRRPGQAVDSPRPDLASPASQRPELDEDPVAVLERGEDGPRVAAGEEVALERSKRPGEVPAEEGVGHLEEVPLRRVGRQLGDGGLLDPRALRRRAPRACGPPRRAAACWRRPWRAGARGRPAELDPEAFAPRPRRPGKRLRVAPAVGEHEVGVLLAPLGERPPAVDRRRRDKTRGLRGIDRLEDLLEVLDELERRLRLPVTVSARKLTSFSQTTRLPPNIGTVCTASRKRFTAEFDLVDVAAKPLMTRARTRPAASPESIHRIAPAPTRPTR
jgi:hypothetical protein